MTPQARSLAWLRDHGYIAESVEKYAPFPDFKSHPCPACGQRRMIPRRIDLFNAFDIIAVRECVHFIQVTTGANSANRMQKMIAHPDVAPNVLKAIRAGVKISVHSWYQNVKKRWELTERPITELMIAESVLALVATEELPF